jgi:hypothetical protein
MTIEPRVTVGMPVYNGERYLAPPIESFTAQDFDDLEIIVSDNASTDATADIAQAAAAGDSRVVYHRNAENIGGARNQNQLVDMARGELFKWGYYDDLVDPTMIGKCVRALDNARRAAALAYPRVQLIDGEGRVTANQQDLHLGLDAPGVYVRLYRLLKRVVGQVQFGVMRALKSCGLPGGRACKSAVNTSCRPRCACAARCSRCPSTCRSSAATPPGTAAAATWKPAGSIRVATTASCSLTRSPTCC